MTNKVQKNTMTFCIVRLVYKKMAIKANNPAAPKSGAMPKYSLIENVASLKIGDSATGAALLAKGTAKSPKVAKAAKKR